MGNTLEESSYPTKYFKPLSNGKIQCTLCPRLCSLQDGQRGMCFVRKREGDKIVLTTFGRSSGFCVDPIEKKPLNHFLPGTPVLSFGTAGCNLACKFCQNWDISKSREIDTLADKASPEKIAETAKYLGCKSVAFTYNDPVIFMEYAIEIAKECHKRGIYTVAVTAGYINPEPRKEFFKHIDAANVDLKSFREEFYHKLCSAHLKPVLDTLVYLKQNTDVWVEVTTLLIPGHNDSDDEIRELSRWVLRNLGRECPLHFSAFHPDYKMMDVAPTPASTLKRAREIALSEGLYYVYTGNIFDEEGQSTYCWKCKKKVIGRNWYEITEYNLNARGECIFCHAPCHGRFLEKAGDWGQKRMPVRLGG
ncbi:MAG: AmmeMemoRadiSam system radical SAM enzyme [Candidatus Dadabacteria bacterium]|nr:MAG: AmmeMemoRadiSam system radical SAM enzyme [Candidatus Dadabacteria bacterium]